MTVPKRFGVLRFIAIVLKVIAWIVLALLILGGIAAALSNFTNIVQTDALLNVPTIGPMLGLLGAGGGGIVAGILLALVGLIYFVVWYAAAEAILLNLAVEENTRLTAALLLRMHQESQPDTRTGAEYGTPYASEPFEG